MLFSKILILKNSLNIIFSKVILISLTSLLLFSCSVPTKEKSESAVKEDNTNYEEGPLASGCPDIVYPDWKSSPYVLPYPVGTAYKIDLSNCSGSYHSKGKPDEFAIDFNMGIGTLITASRPGKVIYVEESGFDGKHPNNLVVVDHGDNTFAEYMHLTNNGALVKVGDYVKQGDEIGLSGSTGLAGYPHLHFVVAAVSWQWPYESVPVTFSNTLSNENSLASGTIYQAFEY
ncbi:MAG: M23 family metallopeptidase [Ignavibacteriales bacterium]|nr:M23 family metallopeptidase [Ignavibacteriales bacterium]